MKISTASRKGSPAVRVGRWLLTAAFWLAVWELAALAVGQEVLLPGPLRVLSRLGSLAATARFWETAGLSLLRVLSGFVGALAAGCVLAVLTAAWEPVRMLLQPLLSVIRATPVASFSVLALVWLQSGRVPGFISFLAVLPMVWANVESGIRERDPRLLEMARVYGFSRWKRLRWIDIPSVEPYFFSAFTTGLGFAWKAGVAAEVIANTRRSVGNAINDAKIYLETADLFAWTLLVILLSFLLEKLLVWLLRKWIRQPGGKTV